MPHTGLNRTADSSILARSFDDEVTKSEQLISVETREKHVVHTFPEGGLHAWLSIFGGFLIQYTTFGYINAFGVYQDYYIREYLSNYTPSEIGWIGGVQVFLCFSSGAIVGRMFDRGHFYKLLVAGTLLQAISLYMLSLSHRNSFYQVFLTNGVGLGLSAGMIYIPSLGIATHYFQRKQPVAMGIVSAGSALGAILHPIMLNRLFKSSLGFHNTVRVSATLNVVLLTLSGLLIRTRLPPKETQQFPVGKWIREPPFAVFLISSIFIFLGLFYPVFYLQLLAVTRGVDRKLAFYALSILNASSFMGRIIPAAFAPKIGSVNMQIFFGLSCGIVVCCMSLIKDEVGMILFAIFYGFTSGAAIALVPSSVGSISKDVNELGTRIGVTFLLGGLLGLFATPISGALLTNRYLWLNASLFAGLSLVVAGCWFFILRRMLRKTRQLASLISAQ